MPVHHRTHGLASVFASCFVQACAFSSAIPPTVGRRLPACGAGFARTLDNQHRYSKAVEPMTMETGSKMGIKNLGRQCLTDEVRTAVEDLDWPPIVARRWISPDEGIDETGAAGVTGGSASVLQGPRLKVLTWNILCDGLSGSHPKLGGFVKSPAESLEWDRRRWKILEEILRWDCDVLALQEVDHHHDWLSPMLERRGYRGLFVKKPVAPGLEYNPTLEDGCSLFYRAKQDITDADGATQTTLELLDNHSFTFAVSEDDEIAEEGSTAVAKKECAADHAGKNNVVVQNQVATLALLCVSPAIGTEDRMGGVGDKRDSLVVVVTTHLKAPKNGHGERSRSRQASQLLYEVNRFRAGHEIGRSLPAGSIPLVVTGDFNATPHPSANEGDPDGAYEPLCYRRVIAHPLGLRSAFPVESTFTTWKIRPLSSAAEMESATAPNPGTDGTRESKHCIDYVWISKGVQTGQRSSLPTTEELGPQRAPSFVYPSDHFALAVQLTLP